MSSVQKHGFHLVDPSPWPFVGSIACFMTTMGAAMYMHSFKGGNLLLISGIIMILVTMTLWWRDIIRESTYQGLHTYVVQRGLRYGMILFIISEVFFFVAFFWAFFHSSLAPSVELGAVWPPKGIEALNPWEVPLLNTVILLSSGATVTWAHHAIISGDRSGAIIGLSLTVLLALIFTAFQAFLLLLMN